MKQHRSAEMSVQAGKDVLGRKANRAIVMVLRDEIRGALADGWSVYAIWETLQHEGSVRFSYQTFRRHVNAVVQHR